MIKDVTKLPIGSKVITKKESPFPPSHEYNQYTTVEGVNFPDSMKGVTFEIKSGYDNISVKVKFISETPHPQGVWIVTNSMIDWDATNMINKTSEERIAEMTL